jgi:hypothetical protein
MVSRLPKESEETALQRFSAHSDHCRHCATPYDTMIRGGQLCERGHMYAVEVARQVYEHAGRVYSMTERTDGRVPVQIECSRNAGAARELLRAIEHGARLRAPTPSYDRHYYVQPRQPRSTLPQRRASIHIAERPAVVQPRPVVHQTYVHRPRGRGSMYNADMQAREQSYRTSRPQLAETYW